MSFSASIHSKHLAPALIHLIDAIFGHNHNQAWRQLPTSLLIRHGCRSCGGLLRAYIPKYNTTNLPRKCLKVLTSRSPHLAECETYLICSPATLDLRTMASSRGYVSTLRMIGSFPCSRVVCVTLRFRLHVQCLWNYKRQLYFRSLGTRRCFTTLLS